MRELKEIDYENCAVVPMTEEAAEEIGSWKYEKPYAAYSFRGREDDYLFDRSLWGSELFYMTDGERVIGQVACQRYEGEMWVGWSLSPELCGRGNGHLFVKRCVCEVRRIKNYSGDLLLRVAASNKRAVNAYRKAGFIYCRTISDEVAYSGITEDFYVMLSHCESE